MKALENPRVWTGGGAFAALLIIAVGWFLFISPERGSVSDLNAQAATTRQENSVLQLKVTSLQIKSKQINKYTSSLKAALSALPFDSGLPAFTRQLSAQGAANGVDVTAVVVGGVTAVAPAAAPAAPTATDGSTSTAPAAAAPVATTPAGGLFSVSVTVDSDGTLPHQLAFLKAVQTAGPRRALISATQIGVAAGSKSTSIDGAASFTTSITVFSAPQTPDQITQLNKLLSGKIGI
jgi:hypothetical protein